MRHALIDRYIRGRAELLHVGAAHRGERSVIEVGYDHEDAQWLLNSLRDK